jgi:HTH-type transcriptional regulator/antitoxin HigA
MTIAPIKTARDYDQALSRIEQLMEAKPGTKAGDELDVLTTLVEVYEAKHHRFILPTRSTRSYFEWTNSA